MSFGIPVRNGLGVGLLASTSLSTRGGGFSPASLFLAGEQGFIYDPSDFTTLYQDPAGTTPVTAVGQTVGLVLDKSRGLVLGPELVANGGFDSGTTGWTARAGCTLSVVDGWLRLTYTGTGAARANFTTLTTVVGRTYKVSFAVRNTASTTTAAFFAYSDAFATQIGTSGSKTAAGSYEMVFTATSTTTNIEVGNSASNGGVGAYLEFDNISVRELPGNHATQSVLASRPILQQDANGKFFLLFDGSDDFLVTNTITPGTDKAQVFAGVRKLSDAGQAAVLSLGNITQSGGLEMFAPTGAGGANFNFSANGGVTFVQATATGYAAPVTAVATGTVNFALATGEVVTRINGSVGATSTGDAGTANLRSDALYIGRRGGTSLPFNGRIYSLIVRFGANLTAAQIAQTEAWVNSKTGAY